MRKNGIAWNTVTQEDVENRPWRLDLIPFLIEPDDWSGLSAALQQRALVHQLLLKDLYSDQRVIREGLLPAPLVFAHNGFLRVAQTLPGVSELPIYSIEVSRSVAGEWFVTNDTCQSPDGLGYALENRMVLSRAMPNLFRSSEVNRLAMYFRALQNYLMRKTQGEQRCVLLAYNASHPHYFEYAYLARYLGYTLVELNDLIVRNERVFLRTVAGLQPVDVILRFIRDQDADPLAVNNLQSVGIPGLLQAVHANNVQVINPLGVGTLENLALNAYLGPLTRYFLNQEPSIASAPTWWLGDEQQMAAVKSRRQELIYRHINSPDLILDPELMSTDQQRETFAMIDALPEYYTAQEKVTCAEVPCLLDEQRTKRQFSLRSYLVRDADNYQLMNGGLCLLSQGNNQTSAANLEASKDVWVMSDVGVDQSSLLPDANQSLQMALREGELPSRVADNLFWLGRYAEKTENIIRVLQAILQDFLGSETRPAATSGKLPETMRVLLKALTEVTDAKPGFTGRGGEKRMAAPIRELRDLLSNKSRYGTLANTVQSVQITSNQLRDRLSKELTNVLNTLNDQQQTLQQELSLANNTELSQNAEALATIAEQLEAMLFSLASFSGLVQENLTHGDNWRFLMLGKRVERIRQSVSIIRVFMQHSRNDVRQLENLLSIFDSVITYRTRYRSRLNTTLSLHLLLLEEENPRSVAYQFRRIERDVKSLPGKRNANHQDPLMKLAIAGISRVRLADTEQLLHASGKRQTLDKFLQILQQLPADLTTALTANYFTHIEVQRSLLESSDTLTTQNNNTDTGIEA